MPSNKKSAKTEKVAKKPAKAKTDRTKEQPGTYAAHPTPAKPKSREDKKAARKAKKAAKKRGVGEEQPPEAQGPPHPPNLRFRGRGRRPGGRRVAR